MTPLFAKAIEEALDIRDQYGNTGSNAVFINSKGARWNKWAFRFSRDAISASLGHDQTATADIYVKAREKLKAARNGLGDWSTILGKALEPVHDAPMTHQIAQE